MDPNVMAALPTIAKLKGHLCGTAVERLPSAQGVILALWDRAPHQAPPLEACFFLYHSPAPPLVFPILLAVSVKEINKTLKKNLFKKPL